MALGNLRSKHNRAVCAWLASQGCGVMYENIFPDESGTDSTRTFPNVTVTSPFAKVEVQNTGVKRIVTKSVVRGSASPIEGQPAGQARVNFDNLCAKVSDAFSLSLTGVDYDYVAAQISAAGRALAVPVDGSPEAAQFAANNSDMVNYTCQYVENPTEGDGEIDASDINAGCSWRDVYAFDAIACASNVD